MLRLSKRRLSLVTVALAGLALSGCASSNGRVPVGFAGGSDCRTVKAELHQMDGQGVPGLIQSAQGGAHVSAESQSKIDRYNYLLEEYLGNDCQLPPTST